MRPRTLPALLGLATLCAAPLSAATLYMSDDENQAIYTVDTATGAATLVGSTVIEMSFSGLAWDSSTGALYVSDVVAPGGDGHRLVLAVRPQHRRVLPVDPRHPAAREARPRDEVRVAVAGGKNLPRAGGAAPSGGSGFGLGLVNPATGEIKFIGNHVTSSNIHGLAYDSANDVLWGADVDGSGGLAEIDRLTGAATLVGAWGTTGEIRGLAYDAATDTLYGVDYNVGSLHTIDRGTGAATLVGALGFAAGYYEGLDIDPDSGVLYLVDHASHNLSTVNPATGAATTVGPLGSGGFPSGLAFVGTLPADWVAIPTLGTWSLALLAAALGAAALFVLRRSA